ncbi:MAG: diphthamide synthesis protein [Candidatus Pacearchaeota archaeon]
MKTLFIEAKLKNLDIQLSKQEISRLPREIVLAYSIQYKEIAYNIAKQLKHNNIKLNKITQVLGCSKLKTHLPILLVGTGRFHATNLYLQSPIIYVLEGNKIIQIPESEINKLKAKRKTAFIKFLSAESIGILVSTKPGQENLNKAIKLKQKLIKQGKSTHIFVSNNIDTSQFENFNINSWINTACPGLANDNSNIINIDDLPAI